MTTVRQISKHWTAGEYEQLYQLLASVRLEDVFRPEGKPSAAMAGALAMIRLDELSQSHLPLYTQLLQSLLQRQEADGGWGDPAATALCVRALLCGRGSGPAVEAGLDYLARLQKLEGIWPSAPLRRMPADAHASAFILCQLAAAPEFRHCVRFNDAIEWFRRHRDELDPPTRQLSDRAQSQSRRPAAASGPRGIQPSGVSISV